MRPRKETISAEYLRSLLDYNEHTGALCWKVPRGVGGRIKPGTPTGNMVTIEGVAYSASRIIWCVVHGEWPDGELFWLNGNSKDRRLRNIGIVPPPPVDGVLTQEYLRKVLHYEPATGQFFYAVTQGPGQFGMLAGSLRRDGGRDIHVAGKIYLASRLAWFYVYGKWPDNDVDHRNHDRDDNRIENLREATDSQNQSNRKLGKNNKTGVKGIHKRKDSGSFRVQCNGKDIGTFKTFKEAIEARIQAEIELQGEYAFTLRVGPNTKESLRHSSRLQKF